MIYINLLSEIFHSLPTQTPVRANALEPILIKEMLASTCSAGLLSVLLDVYIVMGMLFETIESLIALFLPMLVIDSNLHNQLN